MKKSTKLLSVILAVVMIFSTMSVMAFAAKTNYRSGEELTALDAYSPDGAVTRLSTEERMSVVFDFLDVTLAAANINMGEVFSVGSLKLNIDLRSVNALCGTIDNVKSLLNSGAVKLLSGLLGIVKNANLKNWPSGMTRENNAQLDIVNGLANVLNDNAGLVKKVINDGKLDVGVIGNFVDISAVNKYLSDIPGLVKGLVYPLFARVDDDMTLINTYSTTTENPDTLIKNVLINAMSKPQSYTSYKEDASGNCISNHIALPKSAEAGLRDYYVKGSDYKGAYTELEAVIAQAKSIFTENSAYTFDASKADGLTETEAYAKLVSVLGYEYTDEKGNTANLYSGSAENYAANDRFYSNVVAAQIDAVITNLKNAMAPFVCKYVAVPTTAGSNEGVSVTENASLITGITPGSLATADDVLARVTAKDSSATTLNVAANAAGLYGTGATATLSLKSSGAPVAIYTVVIYGDVNGDGVVDGFDASSMDLAINNKTALTGAYKTAGGLATGKVDLANYGLVVDAAYGGTAIAQK